MNKVKVREIEMPVYMYATKCPYWMTPDCVVVHNTANDASAENEIRYMQSNYNQTSFHYAVDEKEAVQGVPLNRNSWHAGDGAYGKGNRYGISIEICYSRSGGTRFIEAEKNAAKLIAEILDEHGWGIDRVYKHQDFSPKVCPHRTIEMGWERFLNMVRAEMESGASITTSTVPNKVGKTFYRVQTGAFRVHAYAKEYLTKVKALGGVYEGAYINKEDGYYKVQVGYFGVKSNADRMVSELKSKGFGAFITEEKGGC